MADDNKLIIEVDADTGQAQVKLGALSSSITKMGKEGSSGLAGLGMATIAFNQAIELGTKVVEALRAALDTIEKSEAFDNQNVALNALGKSVGLSQTQIKTLLDTIKIASHDTLTTAQSTTAAFQLLHAGVKAQNIPTMIEFAERLAQTRPQIGGIDNAISLMANSVERANTRGLAPFLDGIKDVGDRQGVINAILSQASKYIKDTGEGYESFGTRIKTAMSEGADATSRFFGGILKSGGVAVAGTESERLIDILKGQKAALADVDKILSKGPDEYRMHEKVELQRQIEITQKQLNDSLQKEGKIVQDNTSKFQQQKDMSKTLDPTTQARLRVDENVKMYEALEKDDAQYVLYSEKIEQGLLAAKKARIQNEYNEKLKQLNSTEKSETIYRQKYEELERKRIADTIALEKFHESQQALSARNVAAGWHNAMMQMQNEWSSWAKFTQKLAVQSHSVMANSITKMAKEHKFAMDEMLNNFVSMIGETLIQKGSADLLMALFPPNPAGLGVGAAEIALGAALVGASGGASAPTGSTSGAIGNDMAGQQALTQPSAQQQKSAQIVINGDLLNSQETVNHIQQLIRNNSDTTGFAIVAQGKQY